MTNFQSLLVEKITNYGGLFEVKLLGQNALFGAAKGPSSTLTAGKLLMAARGILEKFFIISIEFPRCLDDYYVYHVFRFK